MLDVMIPADSGLGSTAPSEMLDPADHAALTNSQEEAILDPGLGPTVTPNRSLSVTVSEASNHPFPQRSTTDPTTACSDAVSNEALVQLYDKVLPHKLVSMTSSSTNASASATSIAVGGGDE
jgi:hypothetical protein